MLFMISQSMNGISDNEVRIKQDKVSEHLHLLGHEVVDVFVTEDPDTDVKNPGLYYLGDSLIGMSYCDAVFFCKGWEEARGCRIEHEAALAYGLQIMYEKEDK